MRILSWIKREIFHVFPVFVFFLVFFTLINGIETFLFLQSGLIPFDFLSIFIAAALIAKIVLVIDHLPVINLFRRHPMIYVILWKMTIYWISLFIVRIAIRFAPFFWQADAHFSTAIELFLANVDWHLFFSIQMFNLMLLFIFVVFQEVTYRIGLEKMRRLFFERPRV